MSLLLLFHGSFGKSNQPRDKQVRVVYYEEEREERIKKDDDEIMVILAHIISGGL